MNGRNDPDYRGPFFDESVQGDGGRDRGGRQDTAGGNRRMREYDGDERADRWHGRGQERSGDRHDYPDDRTEDRTEGRAGGRPYASSSGSSAYEGGGWRTRDAENPYDSAYAQFTGANERSGQTYLHGAAPPPRIGPKDYRRSDERIREDVCERLLQSHWLDVADVEASVSDGIVTLSGTVRDRAHKYRIEDIVDDTFGVREVRCRLRVAGYGAHPQDARGARERSGPGVARTHVSGISSSGEATGSSSSSYGGGLETGEGGLPASGPDSYHGTTSMPRR